MASVANVASPDLIAKYEPVIGLEVHVQLATRSKIFCACPTGFGAAPNTNVCPVCLGMPGALPVLNRAAVEMAVRTSLALHCHVNQTSRFARKNYFYPDLPKGYQISQYELPVAEHGYVDVLVNGEKKRVGITRVHMEDDAGKSMHEGFRDSDRYTYVDLNRTGTPLIEIVTEPDVRSSDEAYAFLTELKQASAKLLGAQRIQQLDPTKDFRCEEGQPGELQRLAFSQGVAELDAAMRRNSDDVAGVSLVEQFAPLRQERHDVVGTNLFAGALNLQAHAALEATRAHAYEHDPVSMRRVHIRLNLEDHTGEFLGIGLNWTLQGDAWLRRRCDVDQCVENFADAEVIDG